MYQVDLKKNKQTTLAENLKEGQYAVSDDGHLMAYQSEGDKSGGTVIQVMNLSSLETNTVEAASGEKISPLGFVNGDFIYGKMKSEDAGKKASGESITPMYELEIRNSKNKKVASYSFVDKGIYISDILIDDNMVTLNRVEKSGDIYNVTSQEFITNNEERKDTAIKIEVYTTALMEKQMRITFAEGAGEKSVKVIRPNQLASKNELEMVLADNSESVKYYVYGVGELAGIYDKASYAIQKAQKISGVVISSDQKYVWEKGNPDLKPAYIHNLDLRYEWYPASGESVSVALFYKHFRHPIEWTFRDGGGSYTYTFENADKARNYGVEVDIRKDLEFIGLRNFMLNLNGSWIKSKVSFDSENSLEHDRPMQGQSPYLVNAGLFYQTEKAGVMAGVLYNRIGKRIVGIGRSDMSVGGSINNDIPDMYEMPHDALDIVLSKKFGKQVEVKLNAKDVIGQDAVFKQFPRFEDANGQIVEREQTTKRFAPGRSFTLSVSIHL